MTDRPASWRMPTAKQMDAQAYRDLLEACLEIGEPAIAKFRAIRDRNHKKGGEIMSRNLPGLKPRDQIHVPDERHRAFAHPNTLEPVTFEQHYKDVEAIALSPVAPLEVTDAFDRAR